MERFRISFACPVVAAIELTAPLKVDDKIKFKGHITDLEIVISSMQIKNANVTEAKAGDSVGVKVTDRIRPGNTAYKITD